MRRVACLGTLLLAVSLWAQKPEAILDKTARTYAQAKTIEQSTEATIEIRMSRAGRRESVFSSRLISTLLIERPNKIFFQNTFLNSAEQPIGLFVCDGRYLYIENPGQRRTWRQPAPAQLKEVYTVEHLRYAELTSVGIDIPMLAATANWRQLAAEPKLIGQEMVDGRKTYRIRYRVIAEGALLPDFERPIYEEIWIGVNDSLIWKAESTLRRRMGDMTVVHKTSWRVRSQALNKPIPQERFRYKLPQGYRWIGSDKPPQHAFQNPIGYREIGVMSLSPELLLNAHQLGQDGDQIPSTQASHPPLLAGAFMKMEHIVPAQVRSVQ